MPDLERDLAAARARIAELQSARDGWLDAELRRVHIRVLNQEQELARLNRAMQRKTITLRHARARIEELEAALRNLRAVVLSDAGTMLMEMDGALERAGEVLGERDG